MRASVAAILAIGLLATACTESKPAAVRAPAPSPSPSALVGVAVPDPNPGDPKAVGRTITADVDGDGNPDRARLWLHGYGDNVRERVVVVTWTGEVLRSPLGWGVGTRRYPDRKLLGRADVNADGRDELVMYTGGNTAHSGAILTLMDGRLRYADSDAGGDHCCPIYFTGHGNSCTGGCSLDATCQTVDGQPMVVHTRSSLVDAEGTWLTHGEPWEYAKAGGIARVAWSAEVYEMRGASLVLVDVDEGTVAEGAPLPAEYSWDNDLECGTARWGF